MLVIWLKNRNLQRTSAKTQTTKKPHRTLEERNPKELKKKKHGRKRKKTTQRTLAPTGLSSALCRGHETDGCRPSQFHQIKLLGVLGCSFEDDLWGRILEGLWGGLKGLAFCGVVVMSRFAWCFLMALGALVVGSWILSRGHWLWAWDEALQCFRWYHVMSTFGTKCSSFASL